MSTGDPVCPVHGLNVFACIGRSCGPQRFYGDDDASRWSTFGLRIEGTTQALTSDGCTVCDDIPGLTDHGNGD